MKKTFESVNDAYAAGYSTSLTLDNKLFWHYPVECGKLFEPTVQVPGAFVDREDVDGNMPDSVINEMLINALNESLWDLEMGWRMQQAQDVLDNPEDYGLIYDMPEEDKKPLPNFLTPNADKALQMLKDTKKLLNKIRDERTVREYVETLPKKLSEDEYETMMDSQEHSLPAPKEGETEHPDFMKAELYEIFHPEGEMNHFCELWGLTFHKKGELLASNLDDAYRRSQNCMNDAYAERWKTRSTSVGDIIRQGKEYWMVAGMGWTKLDLGWSNTGDSTTITFQKG